MSVCPIPSSARGSKPNVLLLHWHDLGRNLGCYGVPGVSSPRLDVLANEGVCFNQAFCTTPLCSPARGSIFTGRYPHNNGLMGLIPQGWQYNKGERTLPMILRDHGYRTALIGQQHENHRPQTLGFQTMRLLEYWQTCDGIEPLAIEYLEREATQTQPFFASIGFFEVHRLGADHYPADRYPPIDDSLIKVPPFLDDNPETRRDLASFYGAIRVADAAIGRILDVLDRTGLRENTWVIFTTDHGMAFPGAKSTLYDPGIGVACIMRWPKGFTGSRHLDSLFSHVDLVPTILNALGIDTPENIQGISAWNLLASPGSEPHRQFLFAERTHHGTHYDPMRCVRTQRHKLIRNFQPGSPPPIPGDVQSGGSAIHLPERLLTARPTIELYDLDTDPWEQHNLAGSTACQQIRQKLTDELNQWMHLTDDPLLKGPIPLPNAVSEAQHIIKQ